MDNKNSIKALIGTESLLLILTKDVSKQLAIEHQAWLEFEIKNKQLIIQKL